jgi:uncharacterized protein
MTFETPIMISSVRPAGLTNLPPGSPPTSQRRPPEHRTGPNADHQWPSTASPDRPPTGLDRPIRQLSGPRMAAVWAAATGPMAVGSWLVAPRLAPAFGDLGLAKALLVVLSAGLVWQFVLVAALVAREQGSLRWGVVHQALWLRSPRGPATGRARGRLWLVTIPLLLVFAVEGLVLPTLPLPANRDLELILSSVAGRTWLHGAWGWFTVEVVLALFNTVLGEELLFRGYLLPRMEGRFGRWAWLANGVAFAGYHLHMPWAIPGALLDSFVLAYPTQRYRSAWLGIIVHSSQSVFFTIAFLLLVVGQ